MESVDCVGTLCPHCKQQLGIVLAMTITPQEITIKATCNSCHRTGVGTEINSHGYTTLDLRKAMTDNRPVMNAKQKAIDNIKPKN